MILIAVSIIALAGLAAAFVFDGRFHSYVGAPDPGRGHLPELPAETRSN